MSESSTPQASQEATKNVSVTFTPEQQAAVDKIVAERLERDRKSRDLTPDEVRAIKAEMAAKAEEAEAAKSAEQKTAERLAEMEARVADADRRALVGRVQADHGISSDDAALFLTGSDEQTLTAQAKRLAELVGQTTSRPATRREGSNPQPPADERVAFVRRLTGRA